MPPRAVDCAGGQAGSWPSLGAPPACLSAAPGPSLAFLSPCSISWLALLPRAAHSSLVGGNVVAVLLLVCRAHAGTQLRSSQSVLPPGLFLRLTVAL